LEYLSVAEFNVVSSSSLINKLKILINHGYREYVMKRETCCLLWGVVHDGFYWRLGTLAERQREREISFDGLSRIRRRTK